MLARSAKENERRLPIHPKHFGLIPEDLRRQVWIETGYGEQYGVSDAELAPLVGGIAPHADLVANCDVILLPKPVPSDVANMLVGQVIWGWPHCVQDPVITQHAIDLRLTMIAFEAMNHWGADGSYLLHVFHKNNELAGYCSVLHASALRGITGAYGQRRKAAVIGFGATARGAVTALNAHGFDEVQVLTNRAVAAVASPIHSAQMLQIEHRPADDGEMSVQMGDGWNGDSRVAAARRPLAQLLAENDIIVNCVLQNPAAPLTFLDEAGLALLAPGTLIVDVSCDEKMGFSWARPTTFAAPMFEVGDAVHYYAVDHSPSYLWDAATWEISLALLPHLRAVLSGPDGWANSETVARAIEIRDGVIENDAIAQFQGRSMSYPHLREVTA